MKPEAVTTEEVEICQWMTPAQIKTLYEEKKLVPTLDYFFCVMEVKEQDVYVFGSSLPLTQFEGIVIAVYHRFDDIEDKWIVSLDGEEISDEKILGEIAFQEQFFNGKLYR